MIPGEIAPIVERARGGDGEAFGMLVGLYQRLLTSIALGILRDPGLAEEAVQDAFLSAWRGLPEYRGDASFKNWLCRIVVNKSCSMLRWGRLRRWLSLDQTEGEAWREKAVDPKTDANPERGSLKKERSRAVRAAVEALPLQQRTAVLLRANGLDVLEIAGAMGVAEGTVKAHLNHARTRLGRTLRTK